MANKLKLKVKPEQFSIFISKKNRMIDDTIKLKIDNDDILMYSMLGGNVLLAYKNFYYRQRLFLTSRLITRLI
jgi:hypothetical protein